MTAALRLFDGTVSLPGVAFTNETSTGLYRAGSGDMRLAVTGSQVMQFLSTGVAVTGTLSASGNATLSGTLAVTGASTFSGQTNTFENSTAYYPQLINRNKTADANGSYISLQKIRNTSIVQNGDVLGNVIFAGYDGAAYLQGAYINAVISATPGTNDMPTDLVFGTTPDGSAGPTERMRIDKAGNLGLGVTPSAWSSGRKILQLPNGTAYSDIGGYASVSNNWYFNNAELYVANGYATRYYTGGGQHVWQNAANNGSGAGAALTWSTAMTLDASGNLGIGTTSPSSFLSTQRTLVLGAGSGDVGQTIYTGSSSQGTLAFADGLTGDQQYRGYIAYIHSSDALTFGSAGAERARIDSSGNFLVNNTSGSVSGPGTGQAVIACSTSGKFALSMTNTNASGAYGLGISSQTGENIYLYYQGTYKGLVSTSSGGTTYGTTSDYRLKENVQPMQGALAKVAQLKPVTYTWKEEGIAGQGFIAHELQEVVPEAVVGEKDAVDEDGNPKYQNIDTSFLVATLTAAIQEQQLLITQLQADVAALKGQA